MFHVAQTYRNRYIPGVSLSLPCAVSLCKRYILFLSTVVTLKHNIILRAPTEQQHDMTCELCTSLHAQSAGGVDKRGVSPRL